jgi:hypothetical protein
MKKITQEMIHIFKMTDFDWMGYELTKEANYFTFHHIIKKEHGGKEKINNGAVLIGNSAHNYLHIIESRELDMYIYLNKIFPVFYSFHIFCRKFFSENLVYRINYFIFALRIELTRLA